MHDRAGGQVRVRLHHALLYQRVPRHVVALSICSAGCDPGCVAAARPPLTTCVCPSGCTSSGNNLCSVLVCAGCKFSFSAPGGFGVCVYMSGLGSIFLLLCTGQLNMLVSFLVWLKALSSAKRLHSSPFMPCAMRVVVGVLPWLLAWFLCTISYY